MAGEVIFSKVIWGFMFVEEIQDLCSPRGSWDLCPARASGVYVGEVVGVFPPVNKPNLSNSEKQDVLRLARPIGQQTVFRVGGNKTVVKSLDSYAASRIEEVREVGAKQMRAILEEDCGLGSQSHVGGYKASVEEAQHM